MIETSEMKELTPVDELLIETSEMKELTPVDELFPPGKSSNEGI